MTTQPPLFAASVPVLLHYLDRIEGLVARTEGRDEVLEAQLAPDMFSFARQVATAASFALRVACPLAGVPVPRATEAGIDRAGLVARIAAARAGLRALDPAAFAGAEARQITHRAGFAELTQDGATFLHLFGMPNFLFHTGMAFAILRANGIEVGKADFDGQHDYPQGFRF